MGREDGEGGGERERKEGRIELTVLCSFRFSFPKSIPESLSVGELDRRGCRGFDDSWKNDSFPFAYGTGHLEEGERRRRRELKETRELAKSSKSFRRERSWFSTAVSFSSQADLIK